jgi:spore germination protein KC
VVKGGTAQEVMDKASKESLFVHDRLNYLMKNIGGLSLSNKVDLVETMFILDSNFLSLYLPTIQLVDKTKSQTAGTDKLDIKMSGFAVFKKNKLNFYIDNDQALGLNWLMNKIESGIIVVQTPQEVPISLEIIDTKVSRVPRIKDGKLTIDVNVEMSSNIGEVTQPEDIFNDATLQYLNEQQEHKVKEQIESLLTLAQEKQMDFFSTGLTVLHKYPLEWQDIYEKNWPEEFANIEFNVKVKGKINRSYDIKQPNALRGE